MGIRRILTIPAHPVPESAGGRADAGAVVYDPDALVGGIQEVVQSHFHHHIHHSSSHNQVNY